MPTSSSWLNRVGRLLTIPVGDRGTLKWVSRRALLYAVLVIGALVFAYPFLWMIFTSLKSPTAVYQNSLQLIPRSFDWADYPQALNQFPFAEGLENTLIITVGVMVGTLVSVTLARVRVLPATVQVPRPVVLPLPQYHDDPVPGHLAAPVHPVPAPGVGGDVPAPHSPRFFRRWRLGAPSLLLAMLRQFFLTIPRDCDEAAMLDGCGRLRVLPGTSCCPRSNPRSIVVAMFTFLGTWNDFFGPLNLLDKDQHVHASTGFPGLGDKRTSRPGHDRCDPSDVGTSRAVLSAAQAPSTWHRDGCDRGIAVDGSTFPGHDWRGVPRQQAHAPGQSFCCDRYYAVAAQTVGSWP